MIIPIGRQYSANFTVHVWKQVHCESCGGDYVYMMQRQGSGSAFSPLGLANESAKRLAENSANNEARRLLHEGDFVACPTCGWYQRHMILIHRRKQLRCFYFGLLVAVSIVIGLWATEQSHQFITNVLLTVVVSFALWGIGLFISRNPNDDNRQNAAANSSAITRDKFDEMVRAGTAEPTVFLETQGNKGSWRTDNDAPKNNETNFGLVFCLLSMPFILLVLALEFRKHVNFSKIFLTGALAGVGFLYSLYKITRKRKRR